MNYVVLVHYRDPRAGVWQGPSEAADTARNRYANECSRIIMGGIHAVYLCRDGVIVAQATC